jgi:hypothetical protein
VTKLHVDVSGAVSGGRQRAKNRQQMPHSRRIPEKAPHEIRDQPRIRRRAKTASAVSSFAQRKFAPNDFPASTGGIWLRKHSP